jgi:tetratricopeptide (TPR) repeat protein
MSVSLVDQWLHDGITAVQSGNYTQAETSLLRVLEEDDQNEQAWLWLSEAVQPLEEKRIALENVLTLNPENPLAQQRLNLINQRIADAAHPPKEWDDIWSKNVQICGYCAQQLTAEQNRCPACKRNLIDKYYRYAKPSTNLTAYWVLLLGVAQSFILLGAFNLLVSKNAFLGLLNMVWVGVFILLAIGVYFRQNWVFITSLVLMVSLLFWNLITLLVPPNLAELGLENLDPAFSGFLMPLSNNVMMALRIFQLAAVGFGLLFGIFRTAPDFDRVHVRQAAVLTRGLRHASEYHMAARRLSEVGLWATAVLDWQKACGLDPGRVTYKRELGNAYGQLGFYERSLHTLQQAYDLSSHSEQQDEITHLINTIQQKANQTP